MSLKVVEKDVLPLFLTQIKDVIYTPIDFLRYILSTVLLTVSSDYLVDK